MKLRKILSVLLVLTLLVGIAVPCFQVTAEEEHQHTYGAWTFDTVNGTQSRTCSGCNEVEVLHGTTNKATQVTDPVIGGKYYLAANVAGTLQYFFLEGKVTDTVPYSLNVTSDVTNAKIREITLEDPSAVTDATVTSGFQLTFLNSGALARIYCYDAKSDGANKGVMDTGTNSACYKNRHNFYIGEVNGVKVIKSTGNSNVLVAKYNESLGAWRMLGVPESELANEGVYPAMLVTNHTHEYSTEYASDATKHWKACDCGDKAEEAEHTMEWVFDTTKGTQTKTCTVCNYVGETLHGTTNKATQVTEPVIGGKYYLAANVAGTLQYFAFGSSTTDTTPYSLHVSTDTAKATEITLEDPTTANEGTSVGFQMTFSGNNGVLTRIYCYDVKTDGANRGVMDTGHNTANFKGRHTFEIAEVSGVKVLRKLSNNNILVVKYNETKQAWRMLGVPESELANEGVYPAMLVVNHTHEYGTEYEKNESQHWQVCDCGVESAKENHDFTGGNCVCGAENLVHDCANTDGIWYVDGDKHYQKCGTCSARVNEAGHTAGNWVFDTTKGIQTKSCTDCGHVLETLHGTDDKVSQVTSPAVGSSYYLVANVEGELLSFISGGVTETTPYSIKTSKTLATVTVNAALVAGQGDFQMETVDGMLVYSVAAGAGLTKSVNYVTYPEKVSFSMDTVNGVTVLRAYGTQKILAAKYSDAKSAWRIFPVDDSELANPGVFPVMLANLHEHSTGTEYDKDETQHWHSCATCGGKIGLEDHTYVKNQSGDRVCECGQVAPLHTCQSADGKWYTEGSKHYQVCGTCLERIKEDEHTVGTWVFDTAKGIQTKSCTVCNHVLEALHGTDDKVSQVTAPTVGSTYYLVANVDGTLEYFVSGKSTTDVKPYALHVTETADKAQLVTLEDYTAAGTANAGKGFQLVFPNPDTSSASTTLRIYCYDSETSNTAMDTGHNGKCTAENHTFFVDEVNGVKVLRKYGNNNVLVVKKHAASNTYRLMGVPESELANEGVYPAMLATAHSHSFASGYEMDDMQHWKYCSACESKIGLENHTYEKNQSGNRVCECGKNLPVHTCASADNVWYEDGDNHYQLCGICQERIQEAAHTVDSWSFDAAKGTQTGTCSVCNLTLTLYGTAEKGYLVQTPEIGGTYYLAANVDGTLRYFYLSGSVADTTPYSLSTTNDVAASIQVTLGNEVSGTDGFELSFTRASDGKVLSIYCYDAKDSDGIMDTGTNTASTKEKHTFVMDEVSGETVIRKFSNNNVLVVKYNESTGTYRMLGVEESELGTDGVYPAMLLTLHEHSHTDNTYLKDKLGHWFACDCGGKSEYEDHVVTKWTYTKEPTQTTGGQKTGTCTVCGGKAVVDLPPLVAEGHYYLTGKVDGKTYYFRPQTGTESVEDTIPFSLMSTAKESEAMKVNVVWDEKSNTYVLNFTQTRTLNIYMADVNGNTVQQDGKVDLAASATTVEDRIIFRWDPENKRFYQIENGERYVIAFKKMTFTDGKTQAVRMLAVPESELSSTVVPAQLKTVHIHSFSSKWSGDALNHWHECSCDVRKNEGAHSVSEWKVEKEATTSAAGRKSGTCSECGLKVVQAIPMLTDNIKAPSNGVYYLVGTLNGTKHYFANTPSGGSVADTYPYSLYTDPGTGVVTPVKVTVKNGNYRLSYVLSDLLLYMSGDGVGMTSKADRTDLVDFQWDEENKVLYQVESTGKNVLVMKKLRNTNGDNLVRITSMPLEQALIDPNVAIVRLTTKAPDPAAAGAPKDATELGTASEDTTESVSGEQTGAILDLSGKTGQGAVKLFVALAILIVVGTGIVLLLMWLRNSAMGLLFFRKWNVWAGICVMAAGLVLIGALLLPSLLGPKAPELQKFTIVTNETSAQEGEVLAVELYEDYGVSLPVVDVNDFDGDYGIYLNVTGFNSYSGYKYQLSSRDDETGTGIYIDGSGPSLTTAISKWTKSLRKATSFPFGVEETTVGYEWNTGDVNMTGLGFTLEEQTSRQLYEGVEMRVLKYNSFAYGQNNAYAVIVDSDAPVELKVSAGEWDENTTTDNPGEKFTVQQHSKRLMDAGYDVLAITNAGFYDLNTTMTYIPWGMQVVDGVLKKEPNKDNPKNTDNWFGQTADGKYVISNTDGYFAEYETKVSDAVGGGLMLMRDGVPCFSATTPDYRTVVGITKDGDLVMLTISGANYAVVTQAFMDMGLDIDCVLNLDGGGSTTMHALTEEGTLEQYICETPVERKVADAIAIVKK